MSIKRTIAYLLALVLLLAAPTTAVRADIASGVGSGVGMGGVALSDDISIWEGGNTFHIMYKGVQKTLTSDLDIKEYLVVSETYQDTDGTDVTVIYFNFSFLSDSRWEEKIGLYGNETDSDGEIYFHIRMHAPNSYSDSSYCTYSYYITIKNGVLGDFVLARRGSKNGLGPSSIDITLVDDTSYGRRAGRIYKSPFYQGKYTIYCSSPIFDESTYPAEAVYPATPLSGTPPTGGEGGYPYKTTFRMLTDGAAIYNTYYYTSCYMSGADEISAAGKIRLDAVKLVDGTVVRTLPSAPQLLCQKSSYGTAYDIVYTNDDNLLSLLGIDKPTEKYWDVSSQEWKTVSSGSGSGGTGSSGDTPTPEPGVILIDHGVSPLENFVAWLSRKGYPVAADVVYFLGDVGTPYEAFSGLLEEYLGYFTYNETVGKFGSIFDGVSDDWKKISDSPVANLIKKDFTDRFSFDTAKNAYTWSPSKLAAAGVAGIDTALGVGASGTGGTGSGSGSGSGDPDKPGSGSGSGGITIIGGPEWDIIGNISGSVQTGIADSVSNTGSFFSGVLGSAKGILLDLGSVPALLAEFFSFLPAEVITAIGIGLSLWLLPALLGLARSGLKALGSICSSFFGFISSFFS